MTEVLRAFRPLALAAATVGLLAACTSATKVGSSAADSVSDALASTSAAPANASSNSACTIYDTSGNERISVDAPQAIQECRILATNLSQSGTFWTLQPQQVNEPVRLICAMVDGPNTVEVLDSGGAFLGGQTCSGFLQSGWTEDPTAESSASAAASSSSAASSASTAQQSQTNSDMLALTSAYGATGSDMAGIKSDLTGFTSDLSSMAEDVTTTHSDKLIVIADARTSSNNNDGTTCGDAETVAGDTQTVDGDADTIQGDIGTITPDLASLKSDAASLVIDLAAVQSDIPGFAGDTDTPTPSEVRSRVASARHARSAAIIDVNTDIDKANSNVVTAHRYSKTASDRARCSTYEAPPQPIKHIS